MDNLKEAEKLMKKSEEEQKREAKVIQQWLDQEGFKIVSRKMGEEAKRLTTELIDGNDESKAPQIKADIRALKKFTSEIDFYAYIKTI
jgi:hypothetical protein